MGTKTKGNRLDDFRTAEIISDTSQYSDVIARAVTEQGKSDKKELKPDFAKTVVQKVDEETILIFLNTPSNTPCGRYKFIFDKNKKWRISKEKDRVLPNHGYKEVEEAREPLCQEQIAIGEVLEKEFAFGKYRGVFQTIISNSSIDRALPPIDIHQISHICRIGEIHYLLYSQRLRCFEIAVKPEHEKGLAGGGTQVWKTMALPRTIQTVDDARMVCYAIKSCDFPLGDQERVTFDEAMRRYRAADTPYYLDYGGDGFGMWFKEQTFIIVH